MENEKGLEGEEPTQEQTRKSEEGESQNRLSNKGSKTKKSKKKKNGKEKNRKEKNGKENNRKEKNGKEKNGKQKNGKKKSGKKKDADKEYIRLPPCQHAYCLGEVLKKAGIEPGVCRPRPLPWALTGKLPYLPGWEKQCKDYRLQHVCYEVKPKKLNPDQERFANEMKETKILWSFLKPALLFPSKPVYDSPEPGIVCPCKAGFCKRLPPENKEENQNDKS